MTILLALTLLAFSGAPELLDPPTVWKVAPERGGRGGRILFTADQVLLELAHNPDFAPDWESEVAPDENGLVRDRFLRGRWAYSEYESDEEQTVFVEGGFHSLFVNGERFAGDYYSGGFARFAVPLKQGSNRLFVRVGRRGQFKLQLTPATGSCSISPHDAILPHMREGTLLDSVGAVVLLNHTGKPLTGAVLEVGDSQVFEQAHLDVEPLIPYGLAKPAFPLKQLRQPEADELDEKGEYKLSVTLRHGGTSQTVHLPMPLRKTGQPYKATKLSEIDGSVQYYAVRPPIDFHPEKTYALYLTLHGAAVEATGQVAAYSSKRDGFIVAPTNRRPYGFDWQEWGRLDTLETLDMFVKNHRIDPQRIYLTGHSMGGHGAWYLAALYPSRFAATGPSAGWISFSSYTRSLLSEIETDLSAFEWAQMESDTMALVENYTNLPIYAIHGEKDDNVPVRESRRMVEELEKFHKDFVYHEQPGAGHWWDDGSTPGAECVDWIPLFEFFRRHVRRLQPLEFTFKTPNPAISASYAWVTIQSQISPSALSSVTADADPRTGTIKLSTDNVECLEIALGELLPQDEAKIEIDDVPLSTPVKSPVYLVKAAENEWKISDQPDSSLKSAHRSGPFKLAFDKRMVWVYGTSGSHEENAAILAKVRYDAQVWWYRSNGTVTIISDHDFSPEHFAGRNVILYGNADTNSAFSLLPKNCPIQVDRQEIRIGQRSYKGDSGVFFVYPLPGSDENLIGVVGATSPKATRMSFQASYFISGVACPDYVVFGSEVLSKGMAGVLEAGYFDNEWGLKEANP
jgi:dienelactone hydrolase